MQEIYIHTWWSLYKVPLSTFLCSASPTFFKNSSQFLCNISFLEVVMRFVSLYSNYFSVCKSLYSCQYKNQNEKLSLSITFPSQWMKETSKCMNPRASLFVMEWVSMLEIIQPGLTNCNTLNDICFSFVQEAQEYEIASHTPYTCAGMQCRIHKNT